MADIKCQACDEPWDSHHLRYDAIHETELPDDACREFDGQLTPALRRSFEAARYTFGTSIYSLRTCPCCPKGHTRSAAGRRRGALADAAASVLGDDLDGLLAEVSDLAD